MPYKSEPVSHTNIGESWELCGLAGEESVVATGPDAGKTLTQLIERDGSSLLGLHNFNRYGNRFPLLVKFIDASSDLSVQVHPGDELAKKEGLDSGKSEMWYVIHPAESARLAAGFNCDIDVEELDRLLSNGKIEQRLNYFPVKHGDVFYIPAGRVHAICSGAFVAEIQQSSDTTYRLYDYRRTDSNGNLRDLHIEDAKKALDFKACHNSQINYTPVLNESVNILSTEHFITNLLNLNRSLERDYSDLDSFVILVCTEGEVEVSGKSGRVMLHQGNTLLIAASEGKVSIRPTKECSLLETYVSE